MTGSQAASAPERARLDAALVAAHGSGDWATLSRLHGLVADATADPGAARFHLTQAWVYALVAGDAARVNELERRLVALGGL